MRACVCVRVRMYVCVHVHCISAYVCTYVYVYVCVYMHVCYVCLYVCMYLLFLRWIYCTHNIVTAPASDYQSMAALVDCNHGNA